MGVVVRPRENAVTVAPLDRMAPRRPVCRARRSGGESGAHRRSLGRARGGALLVTLDAGALTLAALLTGAPGPAVAGYVLGALFLVAVGGCHRPRITLRLGDELPGSLGRATAATLLLVPAAGARALLAVAAAAVMVTGGRAMAHAILRLARRRGWLSEATVVFGAGRLGREVAATLAAHPELGLVPTGIVDSRPPSGPMPVPWLGDPSGLVPAAATGRVQRVVVCFPEVPDGSLVPLLRRLRDAGAGVLVVPRLYELGQVWGTARDELWGIPVIALRQRGRLALPAKRTMDLVLSALLLLILAPLMPALAVAARAASGGPVLFRQVRMTGRGRTATVLKLRTLLPEPAADPDTQWSAPNERCTRLGGLLRASHVDELPQLSNVLRGEMSLVGPRPERPHFASLFAEVVPGYPDRHRMRAGVTGWAQVHGLCGDTSVAERVRFDNRYIEDWSLWMDATILVRTLAHVVPSRALRGGQATGRSA